jgi:hypothetical protein
MTQPAVAEKHLASMARLLEVPPQGSPNAEFAAETVQLGLFKQLSCTT